MKKLLILLLWSAAAWATDHEILVLENEAGSQIVLTQHTCPLPESQGFQWAYTGTSAVRIYGCWKSAAKTGQVHVLWITPDGESHHRVYAADDFEVRNNI